MKLRTHLIILVVAALLPVLIFAGAMLVISSNQQRSAVEDGLVDTARALSLALDREIEATIRVLQALATSEHLETGDLKQFYDQARRALKIQQGWDTIALFDSGERQLLNLLRPFGSPVPPPPPVLALGIKDAIELKRPVISNLFVGRVSGELRIAVTVPLIHNGKVKYVVAAATPPVFLVKLLKEQNIPADWLATIIDRNQVIVARSRDFEKFVGKPTTPLFAAKSREAREGMFRGLPQESAPVYAGFHRSDLSGWTVGLAIPVSAVESQLRRSLLLAAAGGLALLLLGMALAALFGRRVTASIGALCGAAAALGRGETPQRRHSRIVELNEVGNVIETAAATRKRVEEEILGLSKFPAENPNPILRIGRNGTILYANHSSTPMLTAWGREVGQNVPDDWQEWIVATFESGISKEVEIECDERILSCILAPILAEEYVNVYGRDITERKHAEEQIQRNLERIRALREIDMAITSTLDLRAVLDILLDKIDLVLPYAAATVRLFNRESGLLEPVACRNLDEKEWKAEAWKGGRGTSNIVFESQAPLMIANVQVDARMRDPEFFRKHGLVSYLGVPLVVKGEVLGTLGFYTKEEHRFDSSEVEFLQTLTGEAAIAINNARLYEETRQQSKELERANKIKDEFLSVMSHELRTPLNVVVGYAGMIKDGLLGSVNPRQQEALQKVINRTNDQLGLINNILYAAVLESESAIIETHDFNLEDFLNQLKFGYDSPINKELSLNWDYPFGLPIIRTDSAKLKHILQNLIDNAIKFTGKGSVTISARITEGGRQQDEDRQETGGNRQQEEELLTPHGSRITPTCVEFKVSDTGVGIPKEYLPFVFDKFRQVDSSETRLYGGVGMGLYIVKKFAELLSGTVEVESETGKGSTFTVKLPCGQ